MRNILISFVFVAIGGCQPMVMQSHDEGPVPVTLRVDDAAYWLEEWYRAMELPDNQFAQVLATREQEYAQRHDARNRLRLALLLAAGPEAVRDRQRALSLLEGVDREHASASAQALAALLTQVVREQVGADDKIAALKQDLKQSAVRVKELEQQLQELTNIEQSIQQRETPVEGKENE